jgi:hypothetical protein
MGYEDIQKNIETEEGLSAGEAKVRQMLGELKRVEAPKNFGFAVQARIANARPEDFRTAGSGLAFLRYAVPLALVLTVVSGFVLNGIYNVNDNSVPAVAESGPSPVPAPPSPVVSPAGEVAFTRNDSQVTNSGNETRVVTGSEIAAESGPVPRIRKAVVSSRNTNGGSIDSTQEGRTPIINLNPPAAMPASTPQPGTMGPAGQIPVQAILKIVGIKADSSNEGWKVTAVEVNSLSEHSGVKAGDYIEAINGQPVTEGTRFSGGLIVKSLRVKRDGKTLEIPLK